MGALIWMFLDVFFKGTLLGFEAANGTTTLFEVSHWRLRPFRAAGLPPFLRSRGQRRTLRPPSASRALGKCRGALA